MTARYALTAPPAAVRVCFDYPEEPDFPARANIAPTQPIAIVRRDLDCPEPLLRHFRLVRWGFVPSFIKDFSSFRPFVIARAEDLAEKASFRNALRRRRCLVPADAFYLWQQRGREPSQPFLVRVADHSPFGMAGLVETWVGADGSEIDTACIVTRAAFPATAAVHSRVPVIIPSDAFALWLDPDERVTAEATRLLEQDPGVDLRGVPLGPGINKPTFDDLSVQEPIGPPLPAPSMRAGPPKGELF